MKKEKNVEDYRINDRIKIIMKIYDYNQRRLAEEMDVSAGRISNLINYANKPDSVFLERFLNIFTDVNARWLLTGNGEQMKEKGIELPILNEPNAEYGNKAEKKEVEHLKEIVELQKFKLDVYEKKLKESNN